MSKKEIEESSFLIDAKPMGNPQEFINERAASCLRWYIRKACYYRGMFYTCSLITLLAPLISSVIVGFNSLLGHTSVIIQIITIILGVVSSAATGVLALFHAQEKWTRYRSASEYLKREFALYKAGADKYDQRDAHILFLKNIEEYMMNENLEWQDNQQPDNEHNN